ncbi:MAG: hypothetical protein HW407_1063 [Bacteroidetes bacterium]|nr:hypothetical protein [Bacteroidota bacterium]
MKRFTETGKWDDPWYRKLSPAAKHLLGYLRDKCDCAGVIEVDFQLISFVVGELIDEKHLAELESRFEALGCGKVLMPKFIMFQNGELSETCPRHKPIFKAIKAHGLHRVGIEYHKGKDSQDESSSKASDSLAVVYQYTTDKEKYRSCTGAVQEKEGGVGGGSGRKWERVRFEAPGLEAVKLEAVKIGLPEMEALKFHSYHESKGWVVGRVPMRSWVQAMVTWKLNFDERRYEQRNRPDFSRAKPGDNEDSPNAGWGEPLPERKPKPEVLPVPEAGGTL